MIVNSDIVMSHTCSRKALFEASPNGAAVEGKDTRHRCYGFLERIDDPARHIRIDDLWYRTCPEGEDWRSARHRFDHDQAERLWPVDRKQQGARFAKEIGLLPFTDLTDELDSRSIQKRRNC